MKYKLLGYVLWKEACERLESKRVRAPPERRIKEGPCEEGTLKPTLQYRRASHAESTGETVQRKGRAGAVRELRENGGWPQAGEAVRKASLGGRRSQRAQGLGGSDPLHSPPNADRPAWTRVSPLWRNHHLDPVCNFPVPKLLLTCFPHPVFSELTFQDLLSALAWSWRRPSTGKRTGAVDRTLARPPYPHSDPHLEM